ncbi:DUF2155 domain-containing protein [Dongia sp.]|jgi:hypothetical protein|uniref:DUF2155 domain-containing protein n=1 Tax=Dongia sp. TaxID=1977262 RepID=UPI0035AE995E
MKLSSAGVAMAGLGLSLAVTIAIPTALAIPGDNVVLRAMDKITARVSTITVPVGGTVTFGSLQITAKACDKHPPEETPEASAFLDVVEEKPGEAPQPRFQGWMFASSPALSALEHPVYDLWVLDCTSDDAPAAAQPAESAPANSSTTESGTSQ